MPKGKRIDVDWLREHYPTMTSVDELLDDYEREFGVRPAKTSVYICATRNGIRKRRVSDVEPRDGRVETPVYWSREPEMTAWMLEHDHGQRTDQLSEAFRERFGFGLVRGQIDRFRAAHGTQTRQSRRGGRPRVPVGTERRSKDGYWTVKVAAEADRPQSKDNWRLKHVWIYEQNFGPVPEGCNVYFANHDIEDFSPENLVAVPRRLVGVMNSLGVEWHDRESLVTAMTLAEIRCKRNDLRASMPRTCPVCGSTFDNTNRRGANITSKVCPACAAKGYRSYLGGCKPKYDHDRIRELHAQGLRNEQIADIIGCTRSTVSNVINDAYARRRERRRAARE